MKLIMVPPYKGMNWTPTRGQYMLRELVDNMKRKGQLEGVEIDIDDGYPFPAEIDPLLRDEEFIVHISVGVAKRVRYYSDMGKHDAIIQTGDLDPGFLAGRTLSKVPFASAAHAAIHMASLVGDRFTFFAMNNVSAMIVRRMVRHYGFDHKLVSVRFPSYSSTYAASFTREHPKEERIKFPEVKKIVNDLTVQCQAAIEKDRADSLILGCPAIEVFEDEVRESLNAAGYGEIPIIVSLYAAVEMAMAMVNMKLIQARRAYPTSGLKAKPEFR